MTPTEVEAMDPQTYRAFVDFANRDIRAQNRAARRKK